MDAIVILGLLIAATTFTIAGFITRLKVLNLFSIGIFIALITELYTSAALVIVFIAAIVLQAVYVFTGGGRV